MDSPPSDPPLSNHSPSADAEMPQASGPRKRHVSEVLSDDVFEDCTDSNVSVIPPSQAPRPKNKKSTKKSVSAPGHHSLPGGVASAAALASGRSSAVAKK